MEKLFEGAESYIYAKRILGFDAVIKRRVKKAYRINDLDDSIRTKRTKTEAKILAIASSSGIKVPRVLMVDKYDIYMDRINGENLNDLMGSKDARTLKKYFSDIGRFAGVLHNNNIAHGDYTTANILIANDGVWLIDFGLAEITFSLEEKALDMLLMKRAVSKELYGVFVKSYAKASKEPDPIIKRLEVIEKRGRYQTRTLSATG